MPTRKQPLLSFVRQGPISVGTIQQAQMLDTFNVAEFGKQLDAFVVRQPSANLLLNFEHVDYLSSAVLTELLRVNKKIEQNGGSMRLYGLSDAIREVFEITNLDKLFTIYATETCAEAVKRFLRSLDIEAQEKGWDELRVDD